ncbi:hypothetical protein GE061_017245 [Apolygus lucorum]|uniref:Glucose-methanol-choline oxidoreductase N-terminal domain-containing protein n=1 Tax=Apolygus lucorum TaxID=248454 RepID=A0A8S9XAB4_APOLU|nr:hypothetical protein GE061_017245 [Apolygus lucorum]
MSNSTNSGYLFLGNTAFTSLIRTYETILTASVALYDYPEVNPNLRAVNVPSSELLSEYDFIVVGAGSAGNVVANRLTEISGWNVLLLEAGFDESVVSDTPLLNPNLRNSIYNWNYTSVYQPNACQDLNGFCDMARGRGIGGSSIFNDFVWVRGNRGDYNGWAALGNHGWSYKEVLPYFIRMEDNRDAFVSNSPYHGTGGPMTVSRSPYVTPLARLYVDAAEEMGYPNVDVDGESQVGFQIHRGPIRNGMRCSTGRGYIRPIRNRTNFHVAEGAFVTKINLDSTKTATGVTFMRNGVTTTIKAKNEVILSAGAVNSPQILMLSGIGPTNHLQQLGIPVIQNLSVGNNLQDHYGTTILFKINTSLSITLQNSFYQPSTLCQYLQNQSGPLTSQQGVESEGFYFNNYTFPELGYPDSGLAYGSYWPTNGTNLYYVLPYYGHPTSRGTVRLADKNPSTPPLIDPQYLVTNNDLEQSCATHKFPFYMTNTQALAAIGAEYAQSYTPKCVYPGSVTDNFIICLLNNYGSTLYHLSGTCKMGPPSDPEAVVDPRLRVHGVKGLRVVDASIMPYLPVANINQPTIMIGERASDLIKEDYGAPTNPLPPIPISASANYKSVSTPAPV